MRVLLDCRFQEGAGPNVLTRGLLGALRERARGCAIELAVLRHRGQELPEGEGLETIHVPTRARPLEFLWVQTALPALLRRRRFDLCHGLKHVGPLLAPVPTLLWVHATGQFLPGGMEAQGLPWPDRVYWSRVLRAAVRRATHVTTVSADCRDVLVGRLGVPAERVTVLPPGLDPSFRVVRDPARVAAARRRWELPSRFVLMVGNVTRVENYDTAARALALLKEEPGLEDVKMVWVGEPPAADAPLRELIERLGLEHEIVMTGYLDHSELPAIYNAAELLLLPPLAAGFPTPAMEAMACGVPVVATAVGAIPDVTGEAALLVERPRDAREMGAALRRVLDDDELRAGLVRRGLERSSDFAWSATADTVFDLYERLGDSCRSEGHRA